jgi:release factor glutamine methyltransferase
MVYEPQEDSFLLKEFVKKHAKGITLDMGTGSGLQAREAAHNKHTTKVFAVDIDKSAIDFAKKAAGKSHKKVKWIIGDLFSPFKAKKYVHYFDTIVFNAPYLPQDHHQRDIALEGGRLGNEVIARFLRDVNNYLKPDGIILLVFSSLTPNVKELITDNMLVGKELGKTHMFFEDIFVYLIKRNPILNDLEKKGVCDIKFFARGHRGLVFTGKYKKKVAIKIKRPESAARDTIIREAKMLQCVNKHGIGPKYLFHSPSFLVYEFAEGKYLKNLLKSKNIKAVCRRIFEQCFQLDLLHVSKEEMTRPYKHAIIRGNKVTLIDFERARKVEAVHKNVTQFCEFVCNHFDKKRKKKWIELARSYSNNPSKQQFNKIISMIGKI